MRDMQDRVHDRFRRLSDEDKRIPGIKARLEREIVREDEAVVERGHGDGRRSETTGY